MAPKFKIGSTKSFQLGLTQKFHLGSSLHFKDAAAKMGSIYTSTWNAHFSNFHIQNTTLPLKTNHCLDYLTISAINAVLLLFTTAYILQKTMQIWYQFVRDKRHVGSRWLAKKLLKSRYLLTSERGPWGQLRPLLSNLIVCNPPLTLLMDQKVELVCYSWRS